MNSDLAMTMDEKDLKIMSLRNELKEAKEKINTLEQDHSRITYLHRAQVEEELSRMHECDSDVW